MARHMKFPMFLNLISFHEYWVTYKSVYKFFVGFFFLSNKWQIMSFYHTFCFIWRSLGSCERGKVSIDTLISTEQKTTRPCNQLMIDEQRPWYGVLQSLGESGSYFVSNPRTGRSANKFNSTGKDMACYTPYHIEAETKWPPFSRRHFQV